MPPIYTFKTGYKLVENWDSRALNRAYILIFLILEQVCCKLLTADVCFLRMCNKILNGAMEVSLWKTITQSSHPWDKIISLILGAIFDIYIVKQDFTSIVQIERLERKHSGELKTRCLQPFKGKFLEDIQGWHLNPRTGIVPSQHSGHCLLHILLDLFVGQRVDDWVIRRLSH